MALSPKVLGKKEQKQPKPAHGVELNPTDYQLPKAELVAGVRLSASFDRVVDALFAGVRGNTSDRRTR